MQCYNACDKKDENILSPGALKNYTKKSVIFFTFSLLVLTMILAAVNGNASKPSDAVVHQEWLQTNRDDIKPKQYIERVKAGETTGIVLSKLGFPATEAANMIQVSKDVYPLKNIHIGHEFKRKDFKDSIQVSYQISAHEKLVLTNKLGEPWTADVKERKLFPRISVVEATIQDSLFWDAAKAGLEDALTMQLVDIFAWDIDFARDLRKGDSFKVMYEESFDDEGKRVGYKILAAEFINRGYVYTGIRYENKNGDIEYYDEEGRNLRKTYLKSPVKYSRISSRFTSSRKHPVLGYTRAHRGVDYAAKSGTPIRAIGDGKVIFKGWKGGYGRFIEIRHNNGIHSTAYAHMSQYGKGIRQGSYVKQGQVIGYVGMSGLATGPHLHFEFRSRGRAINPLKIKHKSANPVAKNEMSAFHVKAKEMLRMMALRGQKSGKWG